VKYVVTMGFSMVRFSGRSNLI